MTRPSLPGIWSSGLKMVLLLATWVLPYTIGLLTDQELLLSSSNTDKWVKNITANLVDKPLLAFPGHKDYASANGREEVQVIFYTDGISNRAMNKTLNLQTDAVKVVAAPPAVAEVSIRASEPFSQFSIILFQVSADVLAGSNNTCDGNDVSCLSMLSIQLQSDVLPGFEWPLVPLSELVGESERPLPSGWYQVAFEVSPYGNIWGNFTFNSFTVKDTGGMIDSFFLRDIGVASTGLTPIQDLFQPELLASSRRLPVLDRLCRFFNFSFCDVGDTPPSPPEVPPEEEPEAPAPESPAPTPELPTVPPPDFTAPGPFTVIQFRRSVGRKVFIVYLPVTNMSAGGTQAGPFPALVFGHGLGASVNLYSQMLRQISSHGFVICGPDTLNLFNGRDMTECIALLDKEKSDTTSPLNGILRDGPVGFFGHSMGGRGAAAAAATVGSSAGAVVPMQAAPFYDTSRIQSPIFFTAGSLDLITTPFAIRTTLYRGSNPPKMMATLSGVGHLNPVNFVGGQQFTPYVTAWFKLYIENMQQLNTLFWNTSDPGSILNDPRMSRIDSVE